MKLRLIFLFLVLLTVSAFAAPGRVYRFRGQTFSLVSQKVDGKDYLALDEREVQRLINLTFAQVQFSSSGTSVYFFLPGRQSFWSERSDTVTVNGVDRPAPGQFLAQPKMMEPEALFFALGLKALEDREGWRLASVVTSMKPIDNLSSVPSEPGSVGVKPLQLQVSSPVKPVLQDANEGWFFLEMPEIAWDESVGERIQRFPEADCEIVGGDKSSRNLLLKFRLRPFWEAKMQVDLSGAVQISFEPRHLFRAPQGEVVIQDIQNRVLSPQDGSGEERQVRIALDKGTQFSWNRSGNSLVIEFPAAKLAHPLAPYTGVKTLQLSTSRYPVARLELSLDENQAFEFGEVSDPPHTLLVRIASKRKLKTLENQGMATTAGFSGAAGTVVIDPGHGGGDPGCQNRYLGVCEKDVTLDISLRLREILEKKGWKVVMTRTEDRDVTYAGSPDLMELEARSDVANRINADVFVSIHCNASVSSSVRGSSVYWYKEDDYPLAQSLYVLGESMGFAEQGVLQNRFVVLRTTAMPACLVETAFLTNPVEGAMLADPKIRQGIAERLAVGLERYMQQYGRPKGAKK